LNSNNIKSLLTCSDDETLKLYKISEAGSLNQFGQIDSHANSISLCPTNNSLFAFGGESGETQVASISKALKSASEKEISTGSKRIKTEVPHFKA